MTTLELKVRFLLRKHLSSFRFIILQDKVYVLMFDRELHSYDKLRHELETYFNLELRHYFVHHSWKRECQLVAYHLKWEKILTEGEYKRICNYINHKRKIKQLKP
jgi:hypothetical protein